MYMYTCIGFAVTPHENDTCIPELYVVLQRASENNLSFTFKLCHRKHTCTICTTCTTMYNVHAPWLGLCRHDLSSLPVQDSPEPII